ncbi:hypothetical protein N9Y42_05645 [Mariniblastus sp.]|nr:hypothetical protein [Mariniblastus sp.]
MTDSSSVTFSNRVEFILGPGESFSINPREYLDFDNDSSPEDNLILANFELTTGDIVRLHGDHIFVRDFFELRNFLVNAETAEIGATIRFASEDQIVALDITRQETTLRLSGQNPTDDVSYSQYSDFQSSLEKQFMTRVLFHCNFPLGKVSAVVDQMNQILQAIDYQGPSENPG